MQFSILILLLSLISCYAGSKSKPHSHQGELQPYDNHHIPYSITPEQQAKLDAGDPDVAAPPAICMDRIRDLTNYNKMVPKVRSVSIYDQVKFPNGTEKVGAEFNVALSLLSFNYYLALTFEPKYYTLTWTLDYNYASPNQKVRPPSSATAFDLTKGHSVAISGWSRVLYSTEVKLYSWIPEFVVTFLTKTALVESTTWVRKESELMVKKGVQESAFPAVQLPDLRPCFITDSEGSRYETHCSEGKSSKSEL
eukprot:scaffold2312_cov165-Ochromonas_danica.AAC.82